MLLSVFTVFPSPVLADDGINQTPSVGTEAPSHINESAITVTQQEPDLAVPIEDSVTSVSSVQVASSTANTWIEVTGTVDMLVGSTQHMRVITTLPNAESAEISIDTPSISASTTGGQLQGGELYGIISAQHVGTATLTATVYCTGGATETASIEIYVTMDDGIYLIKNCATHLPTSLGDYYLRVGEPAAAQPVIHASTNTYGDMTNNIYRYWRIEYAGNGCYYIRPLMNESMLLSPVNNSTSITLSDSSAEKWQIQYRNGGYEIATQSTQHNGEGMVLSTYTVQTGIYSPGLGQAYYYAILTLVAVQNMAFERWNFIQSDVSGIYFRNNTTQSVQETFNVQTILQDEPITLLDLGYSLLVFGYDEAPQWTSSNSSIAEINTTTGMITPKKHGTVTIYVYLSGIELIKSFTVTFTLNGTYFLRNLETDLYADIQSGTMSTGNEIEQQTFDGDNTQKWVFTHIGNDEYTIRSAKDNAYYLGVQNDSTTDGTNIVLRTGDVTSGMRWRIEAGNEGYKIVSYSDSSMVLATYSSNSTAGQKLILAEHEDDADYRDEWGMVACSYDYILNVVHYYDHGYDVRFADAGEDIGDYQSVCAEILSEVFGVELNYSIYNYTSCADTCTGVPTTYNDTITSCSHTDIDHKTRSCVRSNLISQYGNGTSILTRVAWTGHVLESRSSNSSSSSHTIVLTIGMATNQSTNENLSGNEIRLQRIYSLLHELSHQIGAPDHYCYDINSENCNNPTGDCYRCDHGLTEPPICVMSTRMRDLETRLNNGNAHTIYCNQCKSSTHAKGILTHLKNHH